MLNNILFDFNLNKDQLSYIIKYHDLRKHVVKILQDNDFIVSEELRSKYESVKIEDILSPLVMTRNNDPLLGSNYN
jgi:hypothetical protein